MFLSSAKRHPLVHREPNKTLTSPAVAFYVSCIGAEDKTLIIWETKRGLALTSLSLHVMLIGFQITSDCSRIVVHLMDRGKIILY